MTRALSFFLVAIFSLSIAIGIQIIAIPWIALDYLSLSPAAVGFIQAALLIPNLLLLSVGGVSADKGDVIKKFIKLVLVYGLIHITLLVLISQHWLSFVAIILYAAALGVVGAFLQPAKDYLLGSLCENRLQKTIARGSLVQYLGQALGVILASFLYQEHLLLVPLVQLLLLFVVVITLSLISRSFIPSEQASIPGSTLSFSLITEGFRYCWQSSVLRSLIAIVAVTGFFHIGVFIVVLPLMAQQVYLGEVGLYSLLQCLFLLGTITASAVIIYRGGLDSPGRRFIFCLLYAGLILIGLSAGPTQYGLLFLIFLWGVVAGVSATMGRSILQSQSLAEYRGRVISVYQLALFGFAPLGSLFAGYIIEYWTVLLLLKISGIVSLVAFGATFLTRGLWDIELEQAESIKQ